MYSKHICLFIGTESQFTGPPDEICPGDDVLFTCVVNSAATLWTFSPPGGPERVCTYLSALPDRNPCDPPDERFRITQTEGSANNFNSSLSVVTVTEDLNGTLVSCTNGGTGNLDSDDICIVGMTIPQTYALLSFNIIILREYLSSTVTFCQNS